MKTRTKDKCQVGYETRNYTTEETEFLQECVKYRNKRGVNTVTLVEAMRILKVMGYERNQEIIRRQGETIALLKSENALLRRTLNEKKNERKNPQNS